MAATIDEYFYLTPIKEQPAPFGFETRGVNCPDGITCLLTFPVHIWDWYDHFQEIDFLGELQRDEVAVCWNLVDQRYPEKVHEEFSRRLYCWIISKYNIYNRT